MAEEVDDESKTEEPTQKKILDAIEKGDVPLSREASIIASILAMLLVCSFMLRNGAIDLTMALERILDNASNVPLNGAADAVQLFSFILTQAGHFLIAAVVVMILAVLIANFAQKTPHF